jgi:tripartite-type tricarboxylate transporter receptor subunit TctC
MSLMVCSHLGNTRYWIALTAAVAIISSEAVAQDSVADFYRGKTITISVGFSAGGGYDLHARTLARLFGKHLPGNPSVVVKNVPGAAGLVLMNALSNTLPKDGTEFATFDRGMALEPLLDPEKARFDSLKLNWIGSTDNDASTCFSWHTSPVKTFDDLLKQELIVSGTGTAGDAVLFPRLLNAVLGTKFKVITGYPGSTESLLAMERGETQGFCSMGFVTLEVTRPQWVRDKKVNILVQFALQKNKDHPEVPLALDFAQTTPDRQAIEFAVSPNLFARPFAAPPGVPAVRVTALRKAFNETMADPDYLADAAGRGMHVQLVTGEEIETVLQKIYAIPKTVVARVKQAVK